MILEPLNSGEISFCKKHLKERTAMKKFIFIMLFLYSQVFLRHQASIAIKYGMEPLEALKAITINPAKLIGMDKRIGSIDCGKDADLVIFNGDPLSYKSRIEKVLIDGKTVFSYNESSFRDLKNASIFN